MIKCVAAIFIIIFTISINHIKRSETLTDDVTITYTATTVTNSKANKFPDSNECYYLYNLNWVKYTLAVTETYSELFSNTFANKFYHKCVVIALNKKRRLNHAWRFIESGLSQSLNQSQYAVQNCYSHEYLAWDDRIENSESTRYVFTKNYTIQSEMNISLWFLKEKGGNYGLREALFGLYDLYSSSSNENNENLAFVWMKNDENDWAGLEDSKRFWNFQSISYILTMWLFGKLLAFKFFKTVPNYLSREI